MPRRFALELNDIKRSDLAGMSREQLEELAWRLHELARLLANRAGEDSSTSSRPPSSDDPYRREERGKPVAADPDGAAADSSDTAPEKAGKPDKNKTAKGSGKQPGAKGHWRCQPIVVSAEVAHAPMVCAACGAALGPDLKRRCVSAHDSLELVRGDMALQVTATRHSYFAVRCPCGHDNVERPRVGLSSLIEGRKRNLRMSERCLVGPMLATFIAALSLRCRLSRRKIQEFLRDWLDLELGVATIERCIHEFGLASEPVVVRLIEDVRAAEIVHLDETPWYQRGVLLWMWVAVTAATIVYRIGSRRKEELAALIGDAFLGWAAEGGDLELVTVNPGLVLGAVLGSDFSASVEAIKKLLNGSIPALPRFGFNVVDVRDIAQLHVLAMMTPEAAGERYIGSGDFYWLSDVAKMVKQGLGDKAKKVPSIPVPDFVARMAALFDSFVRGRLYELGKKRPVSSEKAQRMLGWTPRPVTETVLDTARSLRAGNLI